ncbi:MAG: hypothetical protein C0464_01275 [Cyanobacteria bacterium DS2.008]|nr:hypothetical protein [Cyanobacteria bacterium DS2.008]
MIAFSPHIFSAQSQGGISRGFVELIRGGLKLGCESRLFVFDTENRHLREALEDPLFQSCVNVLPSGGKGMASFRKWRQLRAWTKATYNINVRVVHQTYYSVFDDRDKSTKLVHTLHDLCDEVYYSRFSIRERARSIIKMRSLGASDAIVCVSQSTFDILEDLRPDLARRAVVIHHGIDMTGFDNLGRPVDYPYFIFVGKRSGYKNFEAIVHALMMSEPLNQIRLVCFGGGEFNAAEVHLLRELGLVERVKFVEGGDRLLASYYRNAICLLYPSYHEGFGLPLLEAMKYGCPVIAASATSLPEVGGNAILLCDPARHLDWACAMTRMVEVPNLRETLVGLGHVRVLEFGIDSFCRKHFELYEAL